MKVYVLFKIWKYTSKESHNASPLEKWKYSNSTRKFECFHDVLDLFKEIISYKSVSQLQQISKLTRYLFGN